ERGVGDQAERRQYRRGAAGGERGGGDGEAAEERGDVRRGEAAQRGDRQGGGRDGRAGRRHAAPQRLQGAADAQSGDPRASWSFGCASDHIARSVQLRSTKYEFVARMSRLERDDEFLIPDS